MARPGVVLCIGQNYAAHAAESGAAPPETPIIFFKAPNTVVGPYDDVLMPRGATKTDWEVELAVVIGRRARYLESPAQALAHVAGYRSPTTSPSATSSSSDSGGQWSKGKCCETFNPLGPWLVTAGRDRRLAGLRLRSWVNGEPRQDSTHRGHDLRRGVPDLASVSVPVLEPGDVINTGTPAGRRALGPLSVPGRRRRDGVEIDGLGRQRQMVVPAVLPATSARGAS